jgi:hypothetical protein
MGKRAEHNDWTDALKESLQDFGVAPSEGAWERLEAARGAGEAAAGGDGEGSPRRGIIWWPWAVGLAAASLALGVFLFAPSGRHGNGAPVAEVMKAEEPQVATAAETVEEPLAEAVEEKMEPEVATAAEAVDAPVAEAVAEPAEAAAVSEKALSAHGEPSEAAAVSKTATSAHGEPSETAAVSETATSAHGEPAKEPSETAEKMDKKEALNPFMEPKPARKKVRRHAAIGFSVGTGLVAQASSPAMTAGGASGGPKKAARRYDISELLQHEAPSSFGLQLSFPLSDKLYLETGLDHISMHSSFGKISQDLIFSGLPLRLGYKVLDWGFGDLSVNAGGLWETCVSATLMDKKYSEPQQWSASAGALARCRLFGPVHLYAMPQLSYYFTQTTLPTYRSRQPLSFSFCAGISFDL